MGSSDVTEEKEARRKRKLEKRRKKLEAANNEFNAFSTTNIVLAVLAFAVLLALRFTYDDGSGGGGGKGGDDLMDGVNLYEVLGVEKGAAEKDVKKGYHKMAMKWHPDKNPGCEECKVTFQRAARAYEVLSDPMKRRIYDSEQKMMEKSITSNTAAITTANYKEMVVDSGKVWIIQVYADWSDRCQALSPIWEELARVVEGTGVHIGRVNLGRDRGLAERLMGSKDSVPSVAAWGGGKEIRRVRWEFQDSSMEGIVKWAANAVSEHYRAKALDDDKQLEAFLRKDDRSRALFVGKAFSRDQIAFVCAAGMAGIPLIATTSKKSVGLAADPSMRPPAALTFRGDFVSVADCGMESFAEGGRKLFPNDALAEFLAGKRVNIAPVLYSDTWGGACGAREWCVVAVSTDSVSEMARWGPVVAANEVEAATGRVMAGSHIAGDASEGDVVVLRRAPGRKVRAWVVKGGAGKTAGADVAVQVAMIVSGEAGGVGREIGEEKEIVSKLGTRPVAYFAVAMEVVEDLPVETLIMVYLMLGIVLLILVCPLIKAAIGVPPRGGGEDGEEEEEEDTAGDKED